MPVLLLGLLSASRYFAIKFAQGDCQLKQAEELRLSPFVVRLNISLPVTGTIKTFFTNFKLQGCIGKSDT
jgi:hypothetical protein